MTWIAAAALSAGLLFTTGPARAQVLDENVVRALLGKVDAAVQERDVDGVADTLGQDFSIQVTIELGGQQNEVRMDRAQYLASLKSGWAAMSSYRYERSNLETTFSGGTATAVSDVLEQMSAGDQRIRAVTRETATVVLERGAPVVVKVVGVTRM